MQDALVRCKVLQFLPTPSVRRATKRAASSVCNHAAFLPTPSVRRATCGKGRPYNGRFISTHALREEGDQSRSMTSIRSG